MICVYGLLGRVDKGLTRSSVFCQGALTHGDRRATESRDLSRFNFDNKYGRNALEIVMKSIVNLDSPMVSPPPDYPGEFFKDVRQGLKGVGGTGSS